MKKFLIAVGATLITVVLAIGVVLLMGGKYMSDDFEEDIPEYAEVEDN